MPDVMATQLGISKTAGLKVFLVCSGWDQPKLFQEGQPAIRQQGHGSPRLHVVSKG